MKKNFLSQIPFPVKLFLLALGLRLAYWWAVKTYYFFYENPASDVEYYLNWAQDILARNRPPSVFFGLPLYPYYLAVLKLVCGGQLFLIRLVNVLLGAANCVLLYRLGRSLMDEKVARLAGILCAVNFNLIHYDWLMMPVTLIIAASLFILQNILDLEFKKDKRSWFLLGTLTGIMTLGDGKFLFFAILLVLYLAWKFRREMYVVRPFILVPFLIGMAVVLSATALRNRIIGGDWVAVSAQSGLSFFVGNNPQASGFYEHPLFLRPTHDGQDEDQQIIAEMNLKRRLKPSEVSGFWMKEGLNFIARHPGDYLDLLRRKFLAFWTENEAAYDLDLLQQRFFKNLLDLNHYLLIAPLGIIGMIFASRIYPHTVYPILLILSQFIMTLIFFLTHRHRASVLPFLILFESYTLGWLWQQIKMKDYRALGIVGGCVFMMMFIFRPVFFDQKVVDFIQHSRAGTVYFQRGEAAKAREEYLQTLQIAPDDPLTLCDIGNTYFADKDYQKAVEYYQKTVVLMPQNIDALYNLAYSLDRMNEVDEAIAYYQRVLDLSPGSYDAHFRMGVLLQTQGKFEEAAEHYEATVGIKPILRDYIAPYLEGSRQKFSPIINPVAP